MPGRFKGNCQLPRGESRGGDSFDWTSSTWYLVGVTFSLTSPKPPTLPDNGPPQGRKNVRWVSPCRCAAGRKDDERVQEATRSDRWCDLGVETTVSLEDLLKPYNPPTTSLPDRLAYWAHTTPDNLAYAFLEDGEDDERAVTYAELDAQARLTAARLIDAGLAGGRALLLYPPGLDFVIGLYGCFYAGITVVPAFPPRRNRNMNRVQAIAGDADANAALTTQQIVQRTRSLLDDAPGTEASSMDRHRSDCEVVRWHGSAFQWGTGESHDPT